MTKGHNKDMTMAEPRRLFIKLYVQIRARHNKGGSISCLAEDEEQLIRLYTLVDRPSNFMDVIELFKICHSLVTSILSDEEIPKLLSPPQLSLVISAIPFKLLIIFPSKFHHKYNDLVILELNEQINEVLTAGLWTMAVVSLKLSADLLLAAAAEWLRVLKVFPVWQRS